MQKRFSDELEKERERFVSEKTNSAADYEEVKKALEEKFKKDKLALEKNLSRQKSELERIVEELRQVFTNGVDGLKGKLKEDFLRLLSEHKEQLDNENEAIKKEELKKMQQHSENGGKEMKRLREEIVHLKDGIQSQLDTVETRCSREREILELEMGEKLAEEEENVRRLEDRVASLTEENSELIERARSLERETKTDSAISELEETQREVEELTVEIEKLREDKGRTLRELGETVETLRDEKERILQNGVENLALLEEHVDELETENARLKRDGDEKRGNSRRQTQLERKVQTLESENREMRRNHARTDSEQKREIEQLRTQVVDFEDSMNRRSEKVILAEKARKELCSLERTVEDMEKERKVLESSLYQQNIKNTSLQDEISDLKRRQMNVENRYKNELDAEKERVNLVRTEMSTARSKYLRQLDEVREKLDRTLSNNERDQSVRDKILGDAKVEILTLSNKLEEKAKRCRELEEERLSWEERVRALDRQRREMELRIKKTNESVNEHVTQLSKQLQESQARSIRTDTLVQELYIENAKLTKAVQEIEGAQKKADKSNRQLLEQKRALQRVISKLCGANALA